MTTTAKIMLAALTLAVTVTQICASCADYPDRRITVVVPFAPGGATDIVARTIATDVSTSLGNTQDQFRKEFDDEIELWAQVIQGCRHHPSMNLEPMPVLLDRESNCRQARRRQISRPSSAS